MSRAVNQELLQQTYEVIRDANGITISQIAATVGTDYTGVMRRLATMEKSGILLYESDAGLVYPFNECLTR
jgi:predicted transcriptional regulator